LFAGVDADDPELRAILAPQMALIREQVKRRPESESRNRLLARLAHWCPPPGETQLIGDRK